MLCSAQDPSPADVLPRQRTAGESVSVPSLSIWVHPEHRLIHPDNVLTMRGIPSRSGTRRSRPSSSPT